MINTEIIDISAIICQITGFLILLPWFEQHVIRPASTWIWKKLYKKNEETLIMLLTWPRRHHVATGVFFVISGLCLQLTSVILQKIYVNL